METTLPDQVLVFDGANLDAQAQRQLAAWDAWVTRFPPAGTRYHDFSSVDEEFSMADVPAQLQDFVRFAFQRSKKQTFRNLLTWIDEQPEGRCNGFVWHQVDQVIKAAETDGGTVAQILLHNNRVSAEFPGGIVQFKNGLFMAFTDAYCRSRAKVINDADIASAAARLLPKKAAANEGATGGTTGGAGDGGTGTGVGGAGADEIPPEAKAEITEAIEGKMQASGYLAVGQKLGKGALTFLRVGTKVLVIYQVGQDLRDIYVAQDRIGMAFEKGGGWAGLGVGTAATIGIGKYISLLVDIGELSDPVGWALLAAQGLALPALGNMSGDEAGGQLYNSFFKSWIHLETTNGTTTTTISSVTATCAWVTNKSIPVVGVGVGPTPLPKTQVLLIPKAPDQSTLETLSDENGKFSFDNVPVGDYTLKGHHDDGKYLLFGDAEVITSVDANESKTNVLTLAATNGAFVWYAVFANKDDMPGTTLRGRYTIQFPPTPEFPNGKSTGYDIGPPAIGPCPGGNYTLTVDAVGYKEVSKSFAVLWGEVQDVFITLLPEDQP